MSVEIFIGPMIGGGIALLVAMFTWVWQLSNKTAMVEFLDRRTTALEQANISRGARIDEIADRLSRIEPLIAFAVDHLKSSSHKLGSTAD